MKMGMKTKRRWNAVVFHVIVGGIAIFMFYCMDVSQFI